jgi:hypothetical protein
MKSKSNKAAMHQFFKMCRRQDELAARAAADRSGGCSDDFEEAFQRGNWGFFYLSTYAGPDLFFTRDDFVDNVVSGSSGHMKRPNTKYGFAVQSTAASTYQCLGLVQDFYRTLRNSAGST